jgi:N4-(beta-N-acetylglucosaminyl)-L-asparaginase
MNSITRRKFFTATTASATAGMLSGTLQSEPETEKASATRGTEVRPLIVSTWPFGKAANEMSLTVIEEGGSTLDAVEKGIHVTESDGGNSSVGLSGIPNAAGVVQQDACIMWGPGHQAGSVAAIEGVVHPITAARRVMEHTKHVMLVGKGARWFAEEQGLETVDDGDHENKYEAWRTRKQEEAKKAATLPQENHDTISLLILDAEGNIGGGCSTSGWGCKLPGRVGDSPIIGGGLYVDNEVGAAGATGLGENVMRYCASFMVVEYMRQGLDPEAACIAVIERIAKVDPRGLGLSINFVALDKKGRYGAAGSGNGFSYSVTTEGVSGVLTSAALSDLKIGPIGGNRF